MDAMDVQVGLDTKLMTRSRPKMLSEAIAGMTDGQKRVVTEMGFGGLLELSLRNIPSPFARHIVSMLDTQKMALVTPQGDIPVDRMAVHEVLGFPLGHTQIQRHRVASYNSDLAIAWKNHNGSKKNLKDIADRIIAKTHTDRMFQVDFLILVSSLMIVASKNNQFNQQILATLPLQFVAKDYDWCEYVVYAAKSCRNSWNPDNANSYFLGPLVFLVLLYCDRVSITLVPPVLRNRPVIAQWKASDLTRRNSAEIASGRYCSTGEFLVEWRKTQEAKEYRRQNIHFENCGCLRLEEDEVEDEVVTHEDSKEDEDEVVTHDLIPRQLLFDVDGGEELVQSMSELHVEDAVPEEAAAVGSSGVESILESAEDEPGILESILESAEDEPAIVEDAASTQADGSLRTDAAGSSAGLSGVAEEEKAVGSSEVAVGLSGVAERAEATENAPPHFDSNQQSPPPTAQATSLAPPAELSCLPQTDSDNLPIHVPGLPILAEAAENAPPHFDSSQQSPPPIAQATSSPSLPPVAPSVPPAEPLPPPQTDSVELQVSSPQCGTICVQGYNVKWSVAPILEAIFNKHGDIAAECLFKTASVRSNFLEVVCEVVTRIETDDVIEKMEEVEGQVSDAEAANINVSWLRAHLEAVHKRKEAMKRSDLLMEMKVNTSLVKRAAQMDLRERCEELMTAQERFEKAERCARVLHLVDKNIKDTILETKAENNLWVKRRVL